MISITSLLCGIITNVIYIVHQSQPVTSTVMKFVMALDLKKPEILFLSLILNNF